MYDVNTWRARVGLFNLVKPLGKRKRHGYSCSDIPVMVNFFKHNTPYISNTIQQQSRTKLNTHPLMLLIHISTILYIIFSTNTLIHYIFKSKLHICGFSRLSTVVNFSLFLLLLLCGDIHPNPGPILNYSVCHLNVRSLKAEHRLADVESCLVNFHKFDFIALTETHLGPTVCDDSVRIQDYDFFRLDRNRNGGGVGFYCRSSLSARRLADFECQGLDFINGRITC